MQKFQKSRARKILAAAQASRLALASPVAPGRVELARQQKAKRARDNELTAALKKAGLDIAPLKGLKAAPHDLRKQWTKHTAEMAKRSDQAARTLRQAIDSRRASLGIIGTSAFPPGIFPRPYYVVLDKPFLITRTYGLVMDDSHIESWNSWAKVYAYPPAALGSGSMELSFYHVWQNLSGVPVTVDAHSYLVLNGGAAVRVFGTFLPDSSRHSDLSIDVRFYPWEWWNQPPTSPLAQPDQSQNVMSIHQGGSGWLSDLGVTSQEQDVYRGYDLSYHSWAVPTNGFAVFETCMSLTYSNKDGNILVDFASRSEFSVLSAAVLLHVTPSPWEVVVATAND